MSNVRTVVSLGCERQFYVMYENELIPHHKSRIRNSHMRSLVLGLARSIMFFAFAACMYYGGTLIRDDNLEISKVFK